MKTRGTNYRKSSTRLKKQNKSISKTDNKKLQEKQAGIKQKRREFVMLLLFSAMFLFLIYRVGYIQFVKGEEYQKLAYLNQTQKRPINPKRGTIYDRNGNGLAISASVDTVSVNPKELRDEVKGDESKLLDIHNNLASILGMDSEDVMKRFKANSRFEFIKRIDKKLEQRQKHMWLKRYQKYLHRRRFKRYYPKGKLASHLLGFVEMTIRA